MYECDTCEETFYWEDEYVEHLNDEDHWRECESCTRCFRTQRACNQHMAALGHWKNYCKDCDRHFQSESNLRSHKNSRIYRGINMECPFCKGKYTSATGLTHHLENGSCPRAPKLNREKILQMVRERDPHGFITSKQLTWHDGTRATYSATKYAWNGVAWECYFCHREFGNLNSLNQHLNSPVHQQKAYHCPNRQSAKEFVSLASLFNHLESKTCHFMRFQKVQEKFSTIISSKRMITFG